MCAQKKNDHAGWIDGNSVGCAPLRVERRNSWRLVLLGSPGVGKGTQAQLLRQRLGTCHLSTGDLFRAACNREQCHLTPALAQAMGLMRRGELIPDSTVWEMVRERADCLRCRAGFLLDGFPRTLAQAEQLKRFLDGEMLPLTAVVDYEVPVEEIVQRLGGRRVCESCHAVFHLTSRPSKVEGVCDECGGRLYQRPDDTPASISVRLEAYERSTAPLVRYYKDLGLLTPIDAVGTTDAVFARTITALQARTGRALKN